MPAKTGFPWTDAEIHARVTAAVQAYWQTRTGQATRQQMAGVVDTGSRSEITGGTHLDTFTTIFCDLIRSAGFSDEEVRFRTKVELPPKRSGIRFGKSVALLTSFELDVVPALSGPDDSVIDWTMRSVHLAE
jgi:hypothetical protein